MFEQHMEMNRYRTMLSLKFIVVECTCQPIVNNICHFVMFLSALLNWGGSMFTLS